MPTGTTLLPSTQALSDTPPPKKTIGSLDVPLKQTSPPTVSYHELQFPCPPPAHHIGTSSKEPELNTDYDSSADQDAPESGEAEDEYTLSAYGDISLGEVMVPPLPDPTPSSMSPLRPRIPQPRLRLKVQRPPMPKRRLSYYASGGGVLDYDERWPGSSRPIENRLPRFQHQPLVSSPSADLASPWTQESRGLKKGNSSIEKLLEELLPHSPSIRLSPPGSPARHALGLSPETHERKMNVRRGRSLYGTDDGARMPQSTPAPAPQPKAAPWRTRLPPRLPIPKWDM